MPLPRRNPEEEVAPESPAPFASAGRRAAAEVVDAVERKEALAADDEAKERACSWRLLSPSPPFSGAPRRTS